MSVQHQWNWQVHSYNNHYRYNEQCKKGTGLYLHKTLRILAAADDLVMLGGDVLARARVPLDSHSGPAFLCTQVLSVCRQIYMYAHTHWNTCLNTHTHTHTHTHTTTTTTTENRSPNNKKNKTTTPQLTIICKTYPSLSWAFQSYHPLHPPPLPHTVGVWSCSSQRRWSLHKGRHILMHSMCSTFTLQ